MGVKSDVLLFTVSYFNCISKGIETEDEDETQGCNHGWGQAKGNNNTFQVLREEVNPW